jgi:hypothetical protein
MSHILAVMLNVLFILHIIGMPSLVSSSIAPPMLLIVGDVASSSARLLHEALHDHDDSVPVSASSSLPRVIVSRQETITLTAVVLQHTMNVDNNDGWSIHSRHAVSSGVKPRILTIHQLTTNTSYIVCFDYDTSPYINCDKEHTSSVQFTTLDDMNAASHDMIIAALSCDHSGEDNDRSVFRHMALGSHGIPQLTLHMGDQIYADDLFKRYWLQRYHSQSDIGVVLRTLRDDDHGHDALVEGWRQLHRNVFAQAEQQTILRRGSHWMLSDDHEYDISLSDSFLILSN